MAAGDEPRIVATFDSYAGMLEAIRARVTELQIHGERFDHYSGLPDGYLSKLIGANPTRKLGMQSFAPVLNGLGLKCQFVEDQAATQRLKNHVAPRNNSYPRATYTLRVVTDRQWSRIQKLGRAARWKKLSKKQRSEIMRAVRAGQKSP
jgi:hypothetical protein